MTSTNKPSISYFSYSISEGTRRISYYDWGSENNTNVIVCIGGNSVTADIFDEFARFMCERFRVIAISLPGRGKSDYLNNYQLYCFDTYVNCIYQIFEHLFACHTYKSDLKISFYGRCLGSQIGYKLNELLPSIGLNFHKYVSYDYGNKSSKDMIYKLAQSYGSPVMFSTIEEAENQMKLAWSRHVKNLPNSFWTNMVQYSYKYNETYNAYVPNWDNVNICKAIKELMEKLPADRNVSKDQTFEWSNLNLPILLIKHEYSHQLSSDMLIELYIQENKLKRINKNRTLELIIVPDVGHAPIPLPKWLLEDMYEFYTKL